MADAWEFVANCSHCTRSKASHCTPAGPLCPLPVNSRPWLLIAVDFVTGLPPSEGNTTILSIVDKFSKAVHFVPLVKLPSAFETAHPFVTRVFPLHGIPQDIVSDRGPSLPFRFGKCFVRLRGPWSISLQVIILSLTVRRSR